MVLREGWTNPWTHLSPNRVHQSAHFADRVRTVKTQKTLTRLTFGHPSRDRAREGSLQQVHLYCTLAPLSRKARRSTFDQTQPTFPDTDYCLMVRYQTFLDSRLTIITRPSWRTTRTRSKKQGISARIGSRSTTHGRRSPGDWTCDDLRTTDYRAKEGGMILRSRPGVM